MADNATSLDILIRTIADNAGIEATDANLAKLKIQVQDAAKEMGVLVVSKEDVEKATKKTGEAVEEEGKKVEESGHKAGLSSMQHKALHHAFNALNKISPELGTTLNLLTKGLHSVGDEAETTRAKMSALLTTMGPLIAAMLAVKLAEQVWDSYKEKLEEIHKRQQELTISTQNEVHKMVDAISRLDAALHPEESEVVQAKAFLEKQKQGIEDVAAQQSARNRFNESKEMAVAGTPEQQAAVKEKYDKLQKALDEWKLDELARVTGTMASAMTQRAEQVQKQNKSEAASPEERAAFEQAQGRDAEGRSLQMALDAAIYKQRGIDAATAGVTQLGRGVKGYFGGDIDSAEVVAARKALEEHQEEGNKKLREIRERLEKRGETGVEFANAGKDIGEDASKAYHDAGMSHVVHDEEGGGVGFTQNQGKNIQGFSPRGGKIIIGEGDKAHVATLQELESLTGKSEAQKVAILQKILAHQMTAQQAWEAMAKQVAALQARQNSHGL